MRSARWRRTSRPNTLLDVGAGPGTASWAAAEAFPSLQDFTLLDANAALSRWRSNWRATARGSRHPLLPGDAGATLAEAEPADLVVASYLIGELSDTERRELAERCGPRHATRCWSSSPARRRVTGGSSRCARN